MRAYLKENYINGITEVSPSRTCVVIMLNGHLQLPIWSWNYKNNDHLLITPSSVSSSFVRTARRRPAS